MGWYDIVDTQNKVMNVVGLVSGGKDSCYALHECVAHGILLKYYDHH
jgi:hypothetical protein